MSPDETPPAGPNSQPDEGQARKSGDGFDLEGFKPRPDAKPEKRPYPSRGGERGYRGDGYSPNSSGGGYAGRDSGQRGGAGRGPHRDSRHGSDKSSYGSSRDGGHRGGSDRPSYGTSRGGSDRPSYGGDRGAPSRGSDRGPYGGAGRSGGSGSAYRDSRHGSDKPSYGSSRDGGYRGGSDRSSYGTSRGGSDRPPYGGDRGGSREERYGTRPPRRFGGDDAGKIPYTPKPLSAPLPEALAPIPLLAGAESDRGFTPKASPEIRIWLQLKTDKGRYRHSRFLLEGAKNIADMLSLDPGILVEAFTGPDYKEDALVVALKKAKIPVHAVLSTDIALLSDTETPQGIIAVANFAALKPNWNTAHAITMLDGIQDPGNMGAIFRTSMALGMDAMVLGKGCCDPYNAKVLRSSIGSFMRMPCETEVDLAAKLSFLRQKGFYIVATSSHAQQSMDQVAMKRKVALVMGNEGAGSGPNLLDLADAVVKIPLKKQVESLNVSVAHGILCHELMRHRGAQLL